MNKEISAAIANLDLGKCTKHCPELVCTSNTRAFLCLQDCINYMQHLFVDAECPLSVNITKVGHAFVLSSLHPFYVYDK